jgi:hypothetical protein
MEQHAKKIIVKPIDELSQKDLDASTSLFVIRVNNKGRVSTKDITISGKDQCGKETVHLNIELQSDYERGDRELASIVAREVGSVAYGCIYFVLNAESIDEAARHIEIEIYAKPNFCRHMDLAKLAREYSLGGPSMPSHADLEGDMRRAAGNRGGGPLEIIGRRHSYGSSNWRPGRRKDGGPLPPLYSLPHRAKSNSTRTGGRRQKRRARTQRAHRKRT